jgi:hypothetical protein
MFALLALLVLSVGFFLLLGGGLCTSSSSHLFEFLCGAKGKELGTHGFASDRAGYTSKYLGVSTATDSRGGRQPQWVMLFNGRKAARRFTIAYQATHLNNQGSPGEWTHKTFKRGDVFQIHLNRVQSACSEDDAAKEADDLRRFYYKLVADHPDYFAIKVMSCGASADALLHDFYNFPNPGSPTEGKHIHLLPSNADKMWQAARLDMLNVIGASPIHTMDASGSTPQWKSCRLYLHQRRKLTRCCGTGAGTFYEA